MSQLNFLKIDEIQGESKFRGHEKEIDVLGWNWNFAVENSSQPAPQPPSGRTKVSAFTFTHLVDLATPSIMKACLTHVRKHHALLSIRSGTNTRFDNFTLAFDNVVFLSSTLLAADDGARTIESVSLMFDKVTEEYTQINQDGTAGNKLTFSFIVGANHTLIN